MVRVYTTELAFVSLQRSLSETGNSWNVVQLQLRLHGPSMEVDVGGKRQDAADAPRQRYQQTDRAQQKAVCRRIRRQRG